MTRVTVIGGTGYAGRHIVAAAVARGLEVTSMSRGEVADPVDGVAYVQGSITDPADRVRALEGADVVVVAASPRADMAGSLRPAVAALAGEAATAGVRLGVVGGAGSLRVSAEGPLVKDGEDFPEAFLGEATEMTDILADLRASSPTLDWFMVSPAGMFGAYAPGEFRGEYRIGGEVLLTDAEGRSVIGGADFGAAFVDEIVSGAHRRERFTVAY